MDDSCYTSHYLDTRQDIRQRKMAVERFQTTVKSRIKRVLDLMCNIQMNANEFKNVTFSDN